MLSIEEAEIMSWIRGKVEETPGDGNLHLLSPRRRNAEEDL